MIRFTLTLTRRIIGLALGYEQELARLRAERDQYREESGRGDVEALRVAVLRVSREAEAKDLN